MKQRKKVEWSRLDNASKFFPAVCNQRDTKVFRLACELYEKVEPEYLQHALDLTIESFPMYKSVLRRGIFWYYFESSDLRPTVEEESQRICAPIYHKDRKNLLFRVLYFNNRINLEVFHALSDGTGASMFMERLIYHYLILKHGDEFEDNFPELGEKASISEKMDDSFERYYGGKGRISNRDKNINQGKNGDQEKDAGKQHYHEQEHHEVSIAEDRAEKKRVYHIRGTKTDDYELKVIEGSMPVQAVLDLAHKYGATLTVFITSLFIYSIYKEMPVRKRNHSVVLSVPINLRQFFKSGTARNFFSTMKVGYDFGTGEANLEDIVAAVKKAFREELTESRIEEHMNKLVSLERNPLTRIVPLPLKDYSLRIAAMMEDRTITAAISNIGKINMPEAFEKYIRQFAVFTSARRPQITMCSYGSRLVISFNSPLRETEIQRTFFRVLAENGVEIEISAN